MGRVLDNSALMAALDHDNPAISGEAPTGGPRVKCPNCGRILQAPPGQGTVGLGCKSCLHCYRYDYATGAMKPLGRIEPPPGRPAPTLRLWRSLAIAAAGVALGLSALLVYVFYLAPQYAAPLPDGTPASTLEEVQRQLKSLAD